jgi:hypothetical protein
MAKRRTSHHLPSQSSSDALPMDEASLLEAWNDPNTQSLSQDYAGRWHRLVSTTNWEKGKIISHWRKALVDAGADPTQYRDEVWAQGVGGLTPHHASRLRRVHERFGETQATYSGLFWTHFLVALDWEDAELWLEGASRTPWSVSQMKKARWEARGKLESELPEATIEVAEESELEERAGMEEAVSAEVDPQLKDRIGTSGPRNDGPDFGDWDQEAVGAVDDDESIADLDSESVAAISPFASIRGLPDDVLEAAESLKLSLIRHRSSGWSHMEKKDFQRLLDAFQKLLDSDG